MNDQQVLSMAKWLGSVLMGLVVTVGAARADWYYDDAAIMGTNIEVQVWADSERAGQAAIDAVFAEMERVNQQMSPYIDSSELSQLNASATKAPVTVSAELFALLRYARQMSETSGGAFDITFASVGSHYDYRTSKRPSDEVIARQLAAVNYRHLVLDPKRHTVFYAHPDVSIDLGGIAKGHAVDKAIEKLKKLGVAHAMVTAGGDTRLLGDRLGRPWLVGIRDPRQANRQAVKLPLSNTAISTSGDYERYFEEDGQRYHHILSPATGKSASGVQSVSVIGPSSTTNDALSTSVFVMGLEAGMTLINSLPGVEAIILDNQRRMHFSAGLTDQ